MTIRPINPNNVKCETPEQLRVLPEMPIDAGKKIAIGSMSAAMLISANQSPVAAHTPSFEEAIEETRQPSTSLAQIDSSDVAVYEVDSDARIEETARLLYTVKPDDTVNEILATHTATIDDLITDLPNIDHIVVGQKLELEIDSPLSIATTDETREADIDQLEELFTYDVDSIQWADSPDPNRIQVPINFEEVTIEKGDTLSELAGDDLIYGVATINEVEDTNHIIEGETLIVPINTDASNPRESQYNVRSLTLSQDSTLSDIAAALVKVDVYAKDFKDDVLGLAEELQIENNIEDVTRIPAGTEIAIGPLNEEQYETILDHYSETADEDANRELAVESTISPITVGIEPAPEVIAPTIDSEPAEPLQNITVPTGMTISALAYALLDEETGLQVYQANYDSAEVLIADIMSASDIEDPTQLIAGQELSIGYIDESLVNDVQAIASEVSLSTRDTPPAMSVTEPLLPSVLVPELNTDTAADENVEPAFNEYTDTSELYTIYKLEDFSAEYQEIVANIPDIQDAVELYDFWRTGSFGPQISAEDVVKKNINVGWTGEDLVTAVALELGAESNRSPFVINTWAEKDDRFALGTVAVGGLQMLGNIYGDYIGEDQAWLIDPIRDPQSNLDPMFNAHAAYQTYEEWGNSFGPWEAYTEDMHWQYMDEARSHIANVLADVAPVETVPTLEEREPATQVENGALELNPTLEHPLIDMSTLRPEDGMIVNGELQQITVVDVDGMPVNTEIALNVASMLEAAREAGHELTIGSAHRPMWKQEELRVTNGCPDINESSASACRVPTARPGYSRHQSGLALDLGIKGSAICFPNSKAWCEENGTPEEKAALAWLHENGEKYGLLPLVSGSEAWHFSTDGR